MTKTSLDVGSVYGKRLDTTCCHFPTAVEEGKRKTTVCQLHRLANASINKDNSLPAGARKEVMVCQTCDAALCVRCWESFHTIPTFECPEFERVLHDLN